MRRAVGVLTAVLLVLGVVPPAGAGTAGAPACTDPFTPAFRREVLDRFPGQRVTAAVHDTRTGCWYHLDRGTRITTASVVKAQFLAGTLLRARREGRGLTGWERARLEPTMWLSHNPPATDLFLSLGGVAGMEALDRSFGLTATSHTARWGATVSTAEDRTRLALVLLHGGGPLGSAERRTAWDLMTRVHPTQRWGISAGVPEGWTVALKNGFYPLDGPARWRIGSSGFVRDDLTGEGYAITVQSDHNPDHAAGQRLVELVAAEVAQILTSGGPAARAVERSRCVTTSASETWTGVAARLGVPGGAAGVRDVAGGGAGPLEGMRACAPSLGAAPAVARSAIDGVYRPLVGDFGGDGADDVLWYAPGPAPDFLWRGGPDGRFSSRALRVDGRYEPVVADVDGDGADDVLWYAAGPAGDHLWRGSPTGFTSTPLAVDGTYEPLAGDFDGDGADDVFWYGPGAVPDSLWRGAPSGGFRSGPARVGGHYEPVVGRLDADERDDILWYAPGSAPDAVWHGRADGSFDPEPVAVDGRYQPVVADLDGDQRDDVVWYGPGPAPDHRWQATGAQGFTSAPEDLAGLHRPVVGDLDGDGAAEILFYGPGDHGDVLLDGGARLPRPVSGRYEALAGDFDADGRTDVLWYGRGRSPDHLWLGTGDAVAPRSVRPGA